MRDPSPIRVEGDHETRYPGADKLATECVVNLIRTDSLIAADLDKVFRRWGLTAAGVNVLMILDGAGDPLSPYEIGERRLVTRGTVTGLLDTLEQQELVRRRPHPDDRRMLLVEIAGKGRRLVNKVRRDLFPLQAQLMSVLSDREKETLVRVLGKLQVHLEMRA